MLDSLFLHSYREQTAHMLISGKTELAAVQLVLKFLGACWWDLILCHSQRPVYSLAIVLRNVHKGLKIQPHRHGWILEFRSSRQTLRKVSESSCWGNPLAHLHITFALFRKTWLVSVAREWFISFLTKQCKNLNSQRGFAASLK